jgi:cobalamin synthase
LGLFAAFQFLTLLPVKRSFTVEQIGRSTVYFPVVGLVIGLVLAESTTCSSDIAGCRGECTAGGLPGSYERRSPPRRAGRYPGWPGGHRTVEQRLEIMRDSGSAVLGYRYRLFLLIEYVTLNSIPLNIKLFVLIRPVLSRCGNGQRHLCPPLWPPLRLGRTLKDAVSWQQYVIATWSVLY